MVMIIYEGGVIVANTKKSNTSKRTTSQENGSIGGNMTKNAVERAKKNTNTKALKEEIASEMGVKTGKDATAYENGLVGGEMTRKLYNKGKKSSK